MRDFNKIFIIGLNKTASTSCCMALKKLGIPMLKNTAGDDWIITELHSGNFSLSRCKKYRGFCDSPYIPFYKELDEAHPNSLFIFLDRDLDEWLVSIKNFFGRITPPKNFYMVL